MFEKVNPMHPDKIADRIAGALVDHVYKLQETPSIEVNVVIGHGECFVMAETSLPISKGVVETIVKRISKNENIVVYYMEYERQATSHDKCYDSGVFKAIPEYGESKYASSVARKLYYKYNGAGKVIFDENDVTLGICQSNTTEEEINSFLRACERQLVKPFFYDGFGMSNSELFSDMGDMIGGHGLHGKDLSNPNVSVAIYTFLKAQKTANTEEVCCHVGDSMVDGLPYSEIVKIAKNYIVGIGGFEKLAEWGLT